jgi:hypothetical protein
MVPSADAWAKTAVNKADAGVLINPYWPHDFYGQIIHCLPRSLVASQVRFLLFPCFASG